MKRFYQYLLLFMLGVVMCGCERLLPKPVAPKVVKVSAIKVEDASGASSREYAGTLVEKSATDICFEVGGRVTRVMVRDGQYVKAGQTLAMVDNSAASNAYNAAKATLNRAQDGYDRALQVYERGSLPDVKWVEVQTQLDQAKSMEELSRRNLENCRLVAPVSGRVSGKNIEVGSTVSPLTPVMRIVNLDALYVRVSIPEIDINKVKVGDVARVQISAMDNAWYDAVVEERNIDADPLSHTYMVRMRVKGDVKGLLPGMVCKVSFAGDCYEGGFEVPNRAVQIENNGERFVWVVKAGMAERRRVTISGLTRMGVLIGGGIERGDSVIVDGAHKVSTGSRVVTEE